VAWTDIALVVLGVGFVAMLLRAASIINRNPYVRLRGMEDMGVKFPANMPYEQRQQLLDQFGLAPRRLWRPLALLAVVLVVVVGALLLGGA
jgi:hypothetical protein